MAAQIVIVVLPSHLGLKLIACSPFNDMDNLTDPSSADITCRMLELCTVIIRHANDVDCRPPAHLVRRAQQAVLAAIRYIASKQETDGSVGFRASVTLSFSQFCAL